MVHPRAHLRRGLRTREVGDDTDNLVPGPLRYERRPVRRLNKDSHGDGPHRTPIIPNDFADAPAERVGAAEDPMYERSVHDHRGGLGGEVSGLKPTASHDGDPERREEIDIDARVPYPGSRA